MDMVTLFKREMIILVTIVELLRFPKVIFLEVSFLEVSLKVSLKVSLNKKNHREISKDDKEKKEMKGMKGIFEIDTKMKASEVIESKTKTDSELVEPEANFEEEDIWVCQQMKVTTKHLSEVVEEAADTNDLK